MKTFLDAKEAKDGLNRSFTSVGLYLDAVL